MAPIQLPARVIQDTFARLGVRITPRTLQNTRAASMWTNVQSLRPQARVILAVCTAARMRAELRTNAPIAHQGYHCQTTTPMATERVLSTQTRGTATKTAAEGVQTQTVDTNVHVQRRARA